MISNPFSDQIAIPCTIYRGGTSKAIFIKRNHLPKDPTLRDKIVLAIFGSPDPRQIDGLGGADPLTSKLAVIGPPTREDADVDYTFAQVGVDIPVVDWKGNCGNISAAVGPYAIEEGFVEAKEPVTVVRIHQTNMKRIIIAEVPVKNGRPKVEGDYQIDGVPGKGAKIVLDFHDFAGSTTGKLLPTGNPVDEIEIEGLRAEVSIVDIANPVVFVSAKDLGLKGTESPKEIDTNQEVLAKAEKIRGKVAELLGLVDNWREARVKSPYIPFLAIISPPQDYQSWTTGKSVRSSDIDITARVIFMGVTHKTYPVTGTIPTGVAAKIPDTIVSRESSPEVHKKLEVRIGHPAGIITTEVSVERKDSDFVVKRATVGRTARRIMEGYVYIPLSKLR